MVPNEGSNVKHISDIVGELGKWQFIFISFSFILRGASALSNMGYSFHAYKNDFWCSDVPIDLPVIFKFLLIGLFYKEFIKIRWKIGRA